MKNMTVQLLFNMWDEIKSRCRLGKMSQRHHFLWHQVFPAYSPICTALLKTVYGQQQWAPSLFLHYWYIWFVDLHLYFFCSTVWSCLMHNFWLTTSQIFCIFWQLNVNFSLLPEYLPFFGCRSIVFAFGGVLMLRVQKYQDIETHVILDHNELWPLDRQMFPHMSHFFFLFENKIWSPSFPKTAVHLASFGLLHAVSIYLQHFKINSQADLKGS